MKPFLSGIPATLWHYEKRLYGELGARQSADISYEEAAHRVIESRAGDGEPGGRVALGDAGSGGEVGPEGVHPKAVEPHGNAGEVGESYNQPEAEPRITVTRRGKSRARSGFRASRDGVRSTITLGPDSDPSSLAREAGHMWIEVRGCTTVHTMTIEDIIAGRDLVSWRILGECFRIARGAGLTYRTIQAWQAKGMPHVHDGRYILYSWPEVWAWYKVYFHKGWTPG